MNKKQIVNLVKKIEKRTSSKPINEMMINHILLTVGSNDTVLKNKT